MTWMGDIARSHVVRFSIVIGTMCYCSVAQADQTADKAAAQALYDAGIQLMDQGQIVEGCKKLESSDKLYQGIGVRGRLAECYEKLGKKASAWTMYRSALSMAQSKGDSRISELQARVDQVAKELSFLTITVPAENKLEGMRIVKDGTPLPDAAWGSPVPVDGGSISIEVSAPGFELFRTTITVKNEYDKAAVLVPKLTRTPIVPQNESHQGEPQRNSQGGARPLPEASAPAYWSLGKKVGVGLAGVGILGVGVGSYFGFDAISKNNKSDENGHCNSSNVCDSQGTTLRNDSRSSAALSTALIGIGAAVFVGGGVLFFTSTGNSTKKGKIELVTNIGAGSNQMSLEGVW